MSSSFATPQTTACPAPLSMGFPRQEYWSGLPSFSLGIFPTQGPNPLLLLWQAGSLPLSHQGSPISTLLTRKSWTHITRQRRRLEMDSLKGPWPTELHPHGSSMTFPGRSHRQPVPLIFCHNLEATTNKINQCNIKKILNASQVPDKCLQAEDPHLPTDRQRCEF